jgi:26 proteasome complex subunit DSS1
MSSTSTAATSKPEDTPKQDESPKEGGQIPHLGVLEEDDEFEEFPVQGERVRFARR